MKTCRVCGAYVDDKEFHCPECGADVMIKSSGTLSLKQNTETKPKANPMGQTISTGSGLTDILRAEAGEDVETEDFYGGGSIPLSFTRTDIDGDYSAKKKKKIAPTIFKLILLFAVCFGVYMFVTKVIMKEKDKGVESMEDAIEIYFDSVNANDIDEMQRIVPKFLSDRRDWAESMISTHNGAKLENYKINETETLPINELKNEILLTYNKTVSIQEANDVYISYMNNSNGVSIFEEKIFTILKIDDCWYIYRVTDN